MKVFVQRYPSGVPVQVSLEAVEFSTPVWNPATRGGQELFYQGSDGVMSVRLIDGRPAGPPVRLFAHPPYYYDEARDWDVYPNGDRFLVVERPGPDRPSTEIDIVFNWFTELAARKKNDAHIVVANELAPLPPTGRCSALARRVGPEFAGRRAVEATEVGL